VAEQQRDGDAAAFLRRILILPSFENLEQASET
jgi:hypothetical protein